MKNENQEKRSRRIAIGNTVGTKRMGIVRLMVSKSMKYIGIVANLILAISITGCASYSKLAVISGDFGEITSPNKNQLAKIKLKSGSELEARQLQEESDSVFATLWDYSLYPIAKDSILSIYIVNRNKESEGIVSASRPDSNRQNGGTSMGENQQSFGVIMTGILVGVFLIAIYLNYMANEVVNGI